MGCGGGGVVGIGPLAGVATGVSGALDVTAGGGGFSEAATDSGADSPGESKKCQNKLTLK